MADAITYTTAKLVGIVPNLKTSQNFLLDLFFPGITEADTEEVIIDVDVGLRRMAPFCSPLVEGKLVEQRRYQSNTFKPAYIKDKRAPDLRKPVRRQIGEKIGGELTAGERELANLQLEMADQVDMVNRRLEWMAASALTTGSVTIAGEGFPTTVINFGRSAALTVALTGANRWGQTVNAAGRDTNIDGQITDWAAAILKASGATPTDIVFTNGAWKKFKTAEGVQGAIITPALSLPSNQIEAGPQVRKGGVFMGTWGQFRLWLYNDWYIDASGVEQPMLADGTVIMGGPELMGTRAFGMIMDPKFNYKAMAYAPKTWIMEDPAQRIIMMQSAPLVIPERVNAALCASVL
ncbi:major capsid protein [Sphingomonas sp. CBMAI 2297]|uniref:major capsid protein n=1 Tax=Sphingomonas sp. CBMAI 2297 TaxID=2991720 RepID=UPI0024579994|nr:major capsid protein [Sphingomonas sp. CBMAI 2297]MDH4745829.1 major capsid protein [Sphingomonas sp. CBMAI 2297]